MKILIIGSGGREHTLAWKIKKSPRVKKVYCAPGNAGIGEVAELVNIKATNILALADFAEKNEIDLTIVGPEDPLVNGIVNEFEKRKLKIFGPNKKAAILEGSKIFTKNLLLKHKIPTAPIIGIFKSTDAIRKTLIAEKAFPFVLKVDGLAAGKGVEVCTNQSEAENFLSLIDSGKFGKAADLILAEECLFGEEASYIAFIDKNGNVLPMASTQDHKRVYDEDKGPNTGGMGAYSPAPIVTQKVEGKIFKKIIRPTIEAMKKEGHPYSGILYAGLMIDKKGNPFIVEFNVRFGDPEAQPILMRMKSDLFSLIESALNGTLDQQRIEWDPRPAVCVVMASKGYPDSYEKGFPISGIHRAENINTTFFHAGTAIDERKRLVTAGGRVLGVTALGLDYIEAINNTYQAVSKIKCDNLFWRKDIASRAINR